MNELHRSGEDYLETILLLEQKNDGHVHAVNIANELGFSKPSVSKGLSLLKEQNCVLIDDNLHIRLTTKGRKIAERVYERHRTLRSFLTNILGVSEKTAENDACMMEHNISEETFQKLREFVSNQEQRK
ncbi:MAG: metal-dependent transcriptional regulator [Oscillospiraceae bacterium]|nr:metal-dependent transcriptional regulator [Oscillospiraceae bacterium]